MIVYFEETDWLGDRLEVARDSGGSLADRVYVEVTDRYGRGTAVSLTPEQARRLYNALGKAAADAVLPSED